MDQPKVTLNTNTGVSIGIVVLLFGGFAWVIKGQNEAKTELSMQALMTKNELISKIDKLENRMAASEGRLTVLENAKNVWTLAEMFKWAVHLQQLNKDPRKLQTEGLVVPEPEASNK